MNDLFFDIEFKLWKPRKYEQHKVGSDKMGKGNGCKIIEMIFSISKFI
jgi:hypothetical protein